jgi:hypothetical protein
MIDGTNDFLALLRLVADPATAKARLAELQAATAAAKAREEAALEAEISANAVIASHDKREKDLRDQELALHQEKQRLEARRLELVAFAKQIGQVEDQVKLRVLRYSGLLEGFNPTLQSLPDWPAIEAAVFGRPQDAHVDANPPGPARSLGDDSVVVEPIPDAVAGASVTRSRRVMRRLQDNT